MHLFIKVYNKIIYRPLIRSRLKESGVRFRLGYGSELTTPEYFSIGDNFFTGPYNYFGTNKFNPVHIGNHVMFGPECMIIGGNHDYTFTGGHMAFNQREDHMASEINIEDGVWIGARSIILSNAHIGEGSVIGAMSLVNQYIPPYCIAVGVPAKHIRRRFKDDVELNILLDNVNSKYSINTLLSIYEKYGVPT